MFEFKMPTPKYHAIFFNSLTTEIHLNITSKFSSYHTEDIVLLHYKDLSVNVL
jgi:hypothetical protein